MAIKVADAVQTPYTRKYTASWIYDAENPVHFRVEWFKDDEKIQIVNIPGDKRSTDRSMSVVGGTVVAVRVAAVMPGYVSDVYQETFVEPTVEAPAPVSNLIIT